MASEDMVKVSGRVTGVNRGGRFNVDFELGDPPVTKSCLAVCNGKMKQNQIKVVLGDVVEMEFSPYDLTLGRITRRAK